MRGESLSSRLLRLRFNTFPAYRLTGGRVRYVAADFREVRIELPLTWQTKNVFGTHFGGSMYGAVDPVFAIMLMRLLGPGYAAWDKSVAIRFLKPGRSTLYGRFRLPEGEVDEIRAALEHERSVDRVYEVQLVDRSGVPHAWFEKTVSVRRVEDAAG